MPEGWDAAAFDRWLTTPPDEPDDVEPELVGESPVEFYARTLGECIHCGSSGCEHCQGDEEDWWEPDEPGNAEDRWADDEASTLFDRT